MTRFLVTFCLVRLPNRYTHRHCNIHIHTHKHKLIHKSITLAPYAIQFWAQCSLIKVISLKFRTHTPQNETRRSECLRVWATQLRNHHEAVVYSHTAELFHILSTNSTHFFVSSVRKQHAKLSWFLFFEWEIDINEMRRNDKKRNGN